MKKYNKIIAPTVSGKGILLNCIDNKLDYIHWHDLNELVGRLRRLLASTSAGRKNHLIEINSIVEELTEANTILCDNNEK